VVVQHSNKERTVKDDDNPSASLRLWFQISNAGVATCLCETFLEVLKNLELLLIEAYHVADRRFLRRSCKHCPPVRFFSILATST